MEIVTLGIDLAKSIFALHCTALHCTASMPPAKWCCSGRR